MFAANSRGTSAFFHAIKLPVKQDKNKSKHQLQKFTMNGPELRASRKPDVDGITEPSKK
jgi:hypothetical protein